MKNLAAFSCFGVVAATLISPMAIAQTNDGATPANEGVCDELRYYTPGLYGLCVAFCEAQDFADVSVPLTEVDLEALADGAPSGKILENYNRRRTEADPPMPCIKVEEPCPCWDAQLLDQATTVGPELFCRHQNTGVYDWSDVGSFNSTPIIWGMANVMHYLFEDKHTCHIAVTDEFMVSLTVSPSEFENCREQIVQKAAELGIACEELD